ncbi:MULTISPECIES: argininosuccinate synthase domain-containing protein [Rhizobium]|uniref:argininosuccinate synthase domain-containing protein n=1 Tax=Rhizobium TaxID=379 RepID=UPI0023ED000D|nr:MULTISPECIES: argininosuccinate synthase domain-containing protein [Rhizobium]WET72123.1 argininosuccinate synthase [Rhizobium croatiense]
MPRYAELIYNGFWFSPERDMLQALIDRSQAFVSGEVTLRLYKGNASVISRASPSFALFRRSRHFRGGRVAYNNHDAEGFIRLNGLRLRNWAARNGRHCA